LSGKYRKKALFVSSARSQIRDAVTLQAGRHVHGKIVVTL